MEGRIATGMKNINKRLIQAARKAYKFLEGLLLGSPAAERIIVQPYRGFTNGRQFFLKGRVLQDKQIRVLPGDSRLRNLLNSFKRFESDELPGARLNVHLNGQSFFLTTDEEGYFSLRAELDKSLARDGQLWHRAAVELLELPGYSVNGVQARVDLHFPPAEARFGLISDIDDTVLRTHVTSTLGLRMLYATLLGNAHQRLPMEGVVDLFQELAGGAGGDVLNPVFYVSNSPWNIYDLLVQFLEVQRLPQGPVLLRDYGLSPANFSSAFREHKQESMAGILEMYPNLPFILMGDTGSKDVDHYLEVARKYPDQIKTIYIRDLRNNANVQRVAQLIAAANDVDILLVRKTEEIRQDARRKGYIL